LLSDTIPLYSLYALLFADSGLSETRISTLFLLWSTVGILAEVPSGALADRFSRRAALVAAGLLQATGYVLWIATPSYPSFAAGFVLWGLGGACSSGALEALLYDGLAAAGTTDLYPAVYSRVSAVRLLSQIPAAATAAVLFSSGGYPVVGWVSVGCCLAAAAVATLLPETATRTPAPDSGCGADQGGADQGGADPSYFTVLRSGLAEVAFQPAVLAAVTAVSIVGGLDGLDEYFPLLAHQWGISTSVVPIAVLGIPLLGAAGAALGGPASRLRPRTLGLLLAMAATIFGGATFLQLPIGVAGIALAYGLYQLVLVVTDTHAQRQIVGANRATVTSMATLGAEVTAALILALWALDQPILMAAVALVAAVSLPWLLRPRGARA